MEKFPRCNSSLTEGTKTKLVTKRAFNVKDAATYLGLTEKALYNLVYRGQIPYRRIGTKKILFLIDELDDWLSLAPGLRLEDIRKGKRGSR